MRLSLRRAAAGAGSRWQGAAQPAQPLDIGSDPALLARAALGSDPGTASVAVLRGDQLRVATVQRPAADAAPQAAGAGPAELAPLYEIGSISKVFTGLLLAQAVERGDLSLSDTLGQRLQGKVVFARRGGGHHAGAAGHAPVLPAAAVRRCADRRGRGRAVPAGRSCAALWAALAAPEDRAAAAVPGALQQLRPGGAGRAALRALRQTLEVLVRERITGPLGLQTCTSNWASSAAR
jgi:CubicO group peptidase (beta-lactamase class C family)